MDKILIDYINNRLSEIQTDLDKESITIHIEHYLTIEKNILINLKNHVETQILIREANELSNENQEFIKKMKDKYEPENSI